MSGHLLGRRRVEDLIIASSDGALGEDDLRALRAHLMTCPECTAMAQQHARLAQRLASPLSSESARRVSLERLSGMDRELSGPSWIRLPRFVPAVITALVAAVAVVGGVIAIDEAVGRFEIPQRELVTRRAVIVGGDAVVLEVEDGRFAAGPNQTSGVLVSVELELAPPRNGSAELRFARQGESYGVLGGAPNLSGVTKLRIENRIPPVDSITTFEIWLHIQAPEPLDSEHVVVRIEPTRGGQRARVP